LYKFFIYLHDANIDAVGSEIKIYTGHKRLSGMLNKNQLTHTYCEQDGGYLLRKILDVRDALKFKAVVHHIRRDITSS